MRLAIIQARMSSTRLPGKVMKPALGRPLIDFLLERLARSKRIDHLKVASTTNPAEDLLCDHLSSKGIEIFRGSESDVLDRYYQAALPHRPEAIVRVTSDCPLTDPEVVDQTIDFFEAGTFDYVSNVLKTPVFPKGMDVEVFKFSALQRAWREAKLPYDREHVTPFLYKEENKSWFKLGYFEAPQDFRQERWTVDYEEDYLLVRAILEALYPSKPLFKMEDILQFERENPQLFEMNRKIPHKNLT